MAHPALKPSILVVEDETLLRMVAVDLLEEAGYHVIEATTGDEGAAALAGELPIAGLFTDIQLPGAIDGIALARISHAKHPAAAILVVSGRARPLESDLPCGATFLPKPYNGHAVLRTLAKMIADAEVRK